MLRAIATPLSEAIMVLGALIATVVVASAIMYSTSFLSTEIKEDSASAAKMMSERVVFIDAYVNKSSNCHILFFKNTGSQAIADLDKASLMIGNATITLVLRYAGYNNTEPGAGGWSYSDLENPNDVWERFETVMVIACPPSEVKGPYRYTLALPSGLVYTGSYSG